MRGRLRVVLSLLLAVPVLLTASAPAHACSCVMAGVAKHLARADVAFEGVVREVRTLETQHVLRLDVSRVYAGEVPERVDVVSGRGGGDCGVTLPESEPALVFAVEDHGSLYTGICEGTGTDLHRDHPALAAWTDPSAGARDADEWYRAGSGTSRAPYLWWLGGLVLAGAAVVGLRRYRRTI